jgi:outer membrane protein assembly factor BamB
MSKIKNRIATAIALILMLTIVVTLVALPNAVAQTATHTKKVYPYCSAIPNPAGVGQTILLHIGITDQVSYELYGGLGWQGLTVTVFKPDGTTETLGPYTTDLTGGTGATYVPAVAGTYYFQTNFPETFVRYSQSTIPFDNTTLLAATSPKYEVTVQEEPKPSYPAFPLPTEYWTRPIDSQLREWAPIAENWVDVPVNFIADYNDAPLTAHVLWSKPIGTGGVIGGDWGTAGAGSAESAPMGQSFEMGDAYEGYWESSVIIDGKLYYNRYSRWQYGHAENYLRYEVVDRIVCVDLRTGEELFTINNSRLAFGQIMYWDSFNHHGAYSYLWSVSGRTWNAYDAFTGNWLYGYINVPRGTRLYDENGNILIYTVDLENGYMTLWNSTRCVVPQNTGSPADGDWGYDAWFGTYYDASVAGYEWNKTIPTITDGAVNAVFLKDRVIGSNLGIEHEFEIPTPAVANVWAFSLKPGEEGTLLYNTTWNTPTDWVQGNLVVEWMAFSSEDKIGTLYAKETNVNYGVDLTSGKLKWGPSEPQFYLDALDDTKATARAIYMGKLYSASVSGWVYCYDVKTGERLWSYGLNDTYVEWKYANTWWCRPLFFSGDKIYVGHYEHNPTDPRPRGAPFVCLNATTGQLIWGIDGMFRQTRWGGRAIIGDSIMATMDTYDLKMYAVGKGPTQATVTASPDISVFGSSVLIKGSVIDISPGTRDIASGIQLRFPEGVPAVSDDSMSDWMLYVYKQFPRPADVEGIPITIDVLDSNNNYRNIGTAKTDGNGAYSFMWKPDIPGKYTLFVTFAGSKSYWPSHAETAFGVDEAVHDITPVPTQQPQSMADLYFLPMTIGMIAAIAIVGVVLALLLRKR